MASPRFPMSVPPSEPSCRVSIRLPALRPAKASSADLESQRRWQRLSERQRFGVLFQGVCVIAHLKPQPVFDSAKDGWSWADVDEHGRLCGVSANAGKTTRPPPAGLDRSG